MGCEEFGVLRNHTATYIESQVVIKKNHDHELETEVKVHDKIRR